MKLEDLPNRIKKNILLDSNEHWLWQAYCVPDGYGRLTRMVDGKVVTYWAHRYVYALAKGEIPEGMELDHQCRVRNCVNPDHLQAVPSAVNSKRVSPYFRKIAYIEMTERERLYLIDLLNGEDSTEESRSILIKLNSPVEITDTEAAVVTEDFEQLGLFKFDTGSLFT